MRFLIVGPGAMGCLFASRLSMAGYDVAILDHSIERAEKLTRQGIMVEGITGEYVARIPAFTESTPAEPDFVLMCVKSIKTVSP